MGKDGPVAPTRQERRRARQNTKKEWRPTGKKFQLSDIFSFDGKEDVPISRVFQRLKEGLAVPAKEDFFWDEDPEVREMLCRVFEEDEERSIDVVSLEQGLNECVDMEKNLRNVNGDSMEAGIERDDEIQTLKGLGTSGCSPRVQEVLVVRVLSVDRPHGRGHQCKSNKQDNTRGYASDSNKRLVGTKELNVLGPMTRSKAKTSKVQNSFLLLPNEDNCLEC